MRESKAVLWDMDGTLINSEQLHWISWRNTMANEGVVITHEQFLSTFGQRNDSIVPSWLGAAATAERIARIAQAKEELYRQLVRRVGIALQGLQVGCTHSTSTDGSRQSLRQRRAPTLKPC